MNLKTTTKPTRIFVDLDDVLNQFTLHALQRVGCDVGPFDYHRFNPKWRFDIVAAANNLHQTKIFTADGFWNEIDRDVWVSAPVASGAERLLETCADYVGRESVVILSTPISDPECLAGKLEWVHANMPAWMHRQFLFGPCKYACACPNALLIDDSDKNVTAFRLHGGHAIVMPRPWNNHYGYTDHADSWVEGRISNIFRGISQ